MSIEPAELEALVEQVKRDGAGAPAVVRILAGEILRLNAELGQVTGELKVAQESIRKLRYGRKPS